MPVTRADVLHVAALARLGLDEAHADALASELSGILRHMEVLAAVETPLLAQPATGDGTGTPLRPDGATPSAAGAALSSIAPDMKDGFFIVPRLATHEESGGGGA